MIIWIPLTVIFIVWAYAVWSLNAEKGYAYFLFQFLYKKLGFINAYQKTGVRHDALSKIWEGIKSDYHLKWIAENFPMHRQPLNTPKKVRWFYFFLISCQYFAITLTASNNAVYYLTKGISVDWLAYLGTVSALTIVLFEFPTGLIADRFGSTVSIVLSLMLRGCASFAVVACYGPVMFCFITIISSIGFTCFSGASEAWIISKDPSVKADMGSFFSSLFIFSGIARILGGLTGGMSANALPKLPFLLSGTILLALSVILMTFEFNLSRIKKTRFKNSKKKIPFILIADAKESLDEIYKNKCLLYMISSGIFFIIFCGVPLVYWQPFFYEVMGSTGALGIIWAGFLSMNILGNMTLKLTFFKGKNDFYLFGWLTVFCGLALCLSAILKTSSSGSIGAFFLYQFFLGIIGPLRGKIINKELTDGKRASVLSLISLLESIGSMIGFSMAGYLSKQIGLQYLFFIASIPLIVSFITARMAYIKKSHAAS